MQITPTQAADLQRMAQQALALNEGGSGGKTEQEGRQDDKDKDQKQTKEGGSFTMPTREAS